VRGVEEQAARTELTTSAVLEDPRRLKREIIDQTAIELTFPPSGGGIYTVMLKFFSFICLINGNKEKMLWPRLGDLLVSLREG
jgi:hypothetical protein